MTTTLPKIQHCWAFVMSWLKSCLNCQDFPCQVIAWNRFQRQVDGNKLFVWVITTTQVGKNPDFPFSPKLRNNSYYKISFLVS